MSNTARMRSDEFLKIADQFKLGVLVTESSHPITANLSEVAKRSTAEALDLLFQVDEDVVRKYREWASSDSPVRVSQEVLARLRNGGRIFFTGCGSTGRLSILLDSVWRGFWQWMKRDMPSIVAPVGDYEDRTFSIMAGGDFALIKSVEGFEDYTQFGRKQIAELGVCEKDVVFAITEGGETSWVIGTAWEAVDAGAKVYFVYNNPDDILCGHVQRSREVIEDPRIEKINLTTGPMAITGSTRMQATTIQLCVMMTILEMVVRELFPRLSAKLIDTNPAHVPGRFADALEQMVANLRSPEVLEHLAEIVEMEEQTYRSGHKNNYFADTLGIDVLTDTTERSPTFCVPPFRKFDDTSASDSWAYLFVPRETTEEAWRHILKRDPRTVNWTLDDIRPMVEPDKLDRVYATIQKISTAELMKFKIGLDGLQYRQLAPGDNSVAVVGWHDRGVMECLNAAHDAGIGTALVLLRYGQDDTARHATEIQRTKHEAVFVPQPMDYMLLGGIWHVGNKMLLNALSTCTMVRLGRVMGNYMIYVVPSNLKLIDRATRYISQLTGLAYEEANRLLFEVIEYVEPRMKSDKAYPPVVGMAVTRHKFGLTNEEAEQRLTAG
jgi:N-acetylmuramic acid 6-phosphate etherase